jgi:hypothetical protein
MLVSPRQKLRAPKTDRGEWLLSAEWFFAFHNLIDIVSPTSSHGEKVRPVRYQSPLRKAGLQGPRR